MKKILAFCFAFLLMSITSVSFGNDNPKKETHSYNKECKISTPSEVSFTAFEFSPDRYSGDEFICVNYCIKEATKNLIFNFAIAPCPVSLERLNTKYKINDPISYSEPFVDKSYVWKYSVQFNC